MPAEQISLMLGHVVSDSRDVTEIYAPYDPDYCVDAVAALDSYVRRVLALAAAPVSPGYHPNALLGSAAGAAKSLKLLVGATGFEPVTPTMSMRKRAIKIRDIARRLMPGTPLKSQQVSSLRPNNARDASYRGRA